MNMKVSNACEFYSDLKPLCIARLHEAVNPMTCLYDHQLYKSHWYTTRENENMYSTAICLIALSRSDLSLNSSSLELPEILKALVEIAYRRRFYRVLGLVIWADAVCDGIPLIDLLHRFKISLDELTSITLSMITSEVAWFVSGLIQMFRRQSYDDIGGYLPLQKSGEDAIAEVMTRKDGWEVRTFPQLAVFHHRDRN